MTKKITDQVIRLKKNALFHKVCCAGGVRVGIIQLMTKNYFRVICVCPCSASAHLITLRRVNLVALKYKYYKFGLHVYIWW